MNNVNKLLTAGQSVWYDDLSRELITNGALSNLIKFSGIRGLTSNPTIFEKSIASSTVYNDSIARLKSFHKNADDITEELMIEDIGAAADLLLPVYLESNKLDGFVSIEVSPLIANNTDITILGAKRLYSKLSRPNVMIKVPGNDEGLKAFYTLTEDGVNVNVTLLFSVENYTQVASLYISALENRLKKGLSIELVNSVASFFVSRVDTLIDKKLRNNSSNKGATDLIGKCAIYNSRNAYGKFLELFASKRFAVLADNGAKVQRPLWASTGTKDPLYSDVLYVEELIGKNTVTTLPPSTLSAFIDHGKVKEDSIQQNAEEALLLNRRLSSHNIDLLHALNSLQQDGLSKFVNSFTSLKRTIEDRISKL